MQPTRLTRACANETGTGGPTSVRLASLLARPTTDRRPFCWFSDDDYYRFAPDLPPTPPPVQSVQAWAVDACDAPPPPETSISRSTSGSTLPQVATPGRISPVSSATSPPSSFRGQAPIRRTPSGSGSWLPGLTALKSHHRSGSRASERNRSITFGSPIEHGDTVDDDDAYSVIDDGVAFEMTKIRLKVKIFFRANLP